MTKKIVLISLATAFLGVAMLGLGYIFTQNLLDPKENIVDAQPSNLEKDTTSELTSFKNVDINVAAADISIVEGENFSVEYSLHEQERVKTLKVMDDTLVFETTYDPKWKGDFGNWHVTIRVPKHHTFGTIHVSSIAGDLALKDRQFETAHLKTTSGEIVLSGVEAKELTLKTVSDDISVQGGEISSIIAESVAGDISVAGRIDSVSLNSISGDCAVESEAVLCGAITNISGDIDVISLETSINAKSVGKITYNGANQGRYFENKQDGQCLELKSTSGKITISTE